MKRLLLTMSVLALFGFVGAAQAAGDAAGRQGQGRRVRRLPWR